MSPLTPSPTHQLGASPGRNQYEILPSLEVPGVPAVAPLPTGETEDTNRIVERFGEDVIAAGLHNGSQVVYIQPERLVEVAQFLKTDEKLSYETLIDVTAIDRSNLPIGEDEERFHGVYQFRSYSRKKHLAIVAPCKGGHNPRLPSLTGVFQAANWPERESFDMMGVVYEGHPDLRRILMPKHWPYHPLQKQVPLEGEKVPFTVTWDDPEFSTFGTQVLPSTSPKPDLPPGMSLENMILNVGPHHPSTHGVLRLVVELDGETVLRVDPDLGFLHSGFEKTAEFKRYKDFIYYTDRMDYLSAMNNNLAFAIPVEHMLGVEVPERGEVIRVIMAELQRIAAHLFWLSTHVLDVSGTGMSLLMYATRERERILDLFEMACGARITLSYLRIGGVWQDLPAAFIEELENFVKVMPGKIDEYDDMLTDNPIWQERLEGVGYISRQTALDMGLTGPMLRGSGVDWDLRRDAPYAAYPMFDFDVPTNDRGDGYGRYLVRMEEMRQSVRILDQAVKNLPSGPFKTENRKVTPPPRAELDVSMESLIHHFKLMTEGFRVPAGFYYGAVESNKGELGSFIYSDGSAKPYRVHIHGPSFNNLYAIDHMSRNLMLSDVVTNIGSIDIVLGEVDR